MRLRDKNATITGLGTLLLGSALVSLSLAIIPRLAYAATPASDFSLQISPASLVATLKPGTTNDLELKIHNTGTGKEELKIEPRSFRIDEASGKVLLNDAQAPDIASWIGYSAQTFSVAPGEWYTEKIHLALPQEAGFSYWWAFVIRRTATPNPSSTGGRLINGSLAIFTLINVDRPGAVRKLEIEKFNSEKDTYEYLPATFDIKLKNVGNTIIQPTGNLFIQRSSTDKAPLAVLPVNDEKGYILPGSSHVLQTQWQDGFPSYQTTTTDSGAKTSEAWDWSKLGNFRVGRYSAKLVAVYNDGHGDVALQQETSFWVFPWKIAFGSAVTVSILGVGIWSIIRKFGLLFRRRKHHKMRLQ